MLNMDGPPITCDADIEATVGPRSDAVMTKSISFLDAHCEDFLARTPLLVIGVHGPQGPRLVVMDDTGDPPQLGPDRESRRHLPFDRLKDDELAILRGMGEGSPVGTFALVPGYGETLRINGYLGLDPEPHLRVTEAFLHCAKAVLRSKLWTTGWTGDDAPAATSSSRVPTGWDPDVAELLARAPFALLASVDGRNEADLSPRGDPPGLLHLLDGGRVAIADRRGNLRTDTLHNLVEHGSLGVLALVPGQAEVGELRGSAAISAEPDLLAELAVQGRRPKAAIVVEVDHAERRAAPALETSGLWDPARRIERGELPRAARIWADHVRQHEGTSEAAELARRYVSEEMLEAGLEEDYESGLY
jgi:predicted pyridoxine 5'-phosphate oxidase superfamily flavin-nucleotide-binding protein